MIPRTEAASFVEYHSLSSRVGASATRRERSARPDDPRAERSGSPVAGSTPARSLASSAGSTSPDLPSTQRPGRSPAESA